MCRYYEEKRIKKQVNRLILPVFLSGEPISIRSAGNMISASHSIASFLEEAFGKLLSDEKK